MATKILFSGVEVGSNRTLLEGMGVENVMLSFWGLRNRRRGAQSTYVIGEHFYPEMKVWVDSGATQADKANLSERELEAYLAEYEEFIAVNYDRIEGFTEFDSQVLGLHNIVKNRVTFDNDPKLWVVWHPEYDKALLEQWAFEWDNIAIPGSAVDKGATLARTVQHLKNVYPVNIHALALAKPDVLRQIPFDSVSTLSWLSPMRNGETIVWDGTSLVRYPKKMKAQARLRYKTVVEKSGLDFTKFKEDDTKEATKVAVWSYLELEKSMAARNIGRNTPEDKSLIADNSDDTLYTGLMETGIGASNNSGVEKRKQSASKIIPRDPQEVVPLPVMGFRTKDVAEYEDGEQVIKTIAIAESQSTSLRQCNTCFVADKCPAFTADSTCAFNFPIQVKSREQLVAFLQSIIEMQGQRVAFMRFQEELNGGYADPNVSQEFDRLFVLVQKLKDLDSVKEKVTVTAERTASGGVLAAIFGDKTEQLRQLDRPIEEEEATIIISESIEGSF